MPAELEQAPILSKEQCSAFFDIAQQAATTLGVSNVEVLFGANREALTRFANNTIHQNVAEQSHWMSVRVLIGQKTARASTNRFDDDSIRSTVEQAIALTRSASDDPSVLPLAEPSSIPPVPRFDGNTADATPRDRARAVTDAIEIVERAGQTAAGIFSTGQSVEAIFNSSGVAAWHEETMATFSITAMAEDSSGWAKASSVGHGDFSPVALAKRAADKARLSGKPREIPAGRYTVILEPAAVLDLVGQMVGDFSGTAIEDKRSFLNDRMGVQLFGPNIHIADDVAHPLQSGAPFDGEGVPRRKLSLVDAGVPREVAYSRGSAQRAGVLPTGHGYPLPNEIGEAPVNIVIAGGNASIEEMIASTPRGILVTRLWYIREVEPFAKIMTGMTRDGTFLIEDGKIVAGLRNFRFNQSLIELLNSVEALSVPVRASGEEAFDMVVPAMLVRNFHFTEVTKF